MTEKGSEECALSLIGKWVVEMDFQVSSEAHCKLRSWGLTERQALALLRPGGWAGGAGKTGEDGWMHPMTQGCVLESSWAGQEGAEAWLWMCCWW